MTKVYSRVFENHIEWYKEGTDILHREDGPAIEWNDGTKEWWQNDKVHRVDGPAIECSNGDKFWYQNGKRHRADGLAIEYSDGYKEYCLYGKCYPDIKTDEEWLIFQIIN